MAAANESITVEEVERALAEIENKYSPKRKCSKESFEETLIVLSTEFDSLGLPTLDLSQSWKKVFQQVVQNSRCLVQIHRKTVSQIKDVNINSRCQSTKTSELHKKIDEYKLKVARNEDQNSLLQNKIIKLNNEQSNLVKREAQLKEELEKTKRYYSSKQNELQHNIQKLIKDNQHLREIFGKDINTSNGRDDITMKMMKKFKGNEEIYKSTIQKLQENNKELLEEVLNLKEEIAVNLCNNKEDYT